MGVTDSPGWGMQKNYTWQTQSIQDNSRSEWNVERMEECARSISQRQIRPVVIRIIQVEIKMSQLLNIKMYRDLSFQQSSSVMIIALARLCNVIKLIGFESQYLMMVLWWLCWQYCTCVTWKWSGKLGSRLQISRHSINWGLMPSSSHTRKLMFVPPKTLIKNDLTFTTKPKFIIIKLKRGLNFGKLVVKIWLRERQRPW